MPSFAGTGRKERIPEDARDDEQQADAMTPSHLLLQNEEREYDRSDGNDRREQPGDRPWYLLHSGIPQDVPQHGHDDRIIPNVRSLAGGQMQPFHPYDIVNRKRQKP